MGLSWKGVREREETVSRRKVHEFKSQKQKGANKKEGKRTAQVRKRKHQDKPSKNKVCVRAPKGSLLLCMLTIKPK